jgi:NADPH oxidase 5
LKKKVFDVDGDGHLSLEEMRMMLKCCLEDSPSLNKNETVDDLAAALFRNTDIDNSGDISLEELKDAFDKHKAIFNSLSVCTSIWIKPKFVNKPKKNKLLHNIKTRILNEQALFVFWTFYGIIHFGCMLSAFLKYRNENIWTIFARMFGNSLNFNCSLIVFLILRKFSTWLRIKGAGSMVPLDNFIEIHKIIGQVILVETIIHTIAHIINLYVKSKLKSLNYWNCLFTAQLSLGYPTGIIELFLLVIIIIFAMPFVRNKGFFQLFYLIHVLTIPWLIIMLLHGPRFWIWLLFPGGCFVIEKLLRYRKISSNNFGDTMITEALTLPSKTTYLVIRRPPKFHYNAGDYVFINIPVIAKYEWHPFSISSAPENSDYVWLHIRAVGNWTKKLYQFSLNSSFGETTMDGVNLINRNRMIKIVSKKNDDHNTDNNNTNDSNTNNNECDPNKTVDEPSERIGICNRNSMKAKVARYLINANFSSSIDTAQNYKKVSFGIIKSKEKTNNINANPYDSSSKNEHSYDNNIDFISFIIKILIFV